MLLKKYNMACMRRKQASDTSSDSAIKVREKKDRPRTRAQQGFS
jgi:hypothetical protein